AIKELNKYIATNDKSWEAYFLRGWAYRTLENFQDAQKDLLESLRIDGKNGEVYNELSICARESGDIELAKSYLQIAVDLDEENMTYITNLAFLHLADKEYLESRELLEKGRTIDPEDPQLLYLIKEYSEKTGDIIGEVISEEIYSDEDFKELHEKEHENHHHHEEI
ncbi:MAG: tetratricopeptide repeat protein, partial [Sphaerochaetaceae bacterium]|nr:tetratricopeptide repeat protein [Sphaerochaetaceae bacterium]